jgi:hypothetical protein
MPKKIINYNDSNDISNKLKKKNNLKKNYDFCFFFKKFKLKKDKIEIFLYDKKKNIMNSINNI